MTTQSASPAVDDVDLTGSGSLAGKTLAMSVGCELMHNQLPGSPIEPTTDIAVVQDKAGNPMIFTIGSDRKLRLLKADSGSVTGFTAIDLSAGFTGSGGAAAFDVSEDLAGNITVVVAMLRDSGPATNLFIAPMLSNDPAKTDWTSFSKLVRPITGIDAKFVAQQIRMGTSDDGNAPFVAIVGALDSQLFHYQLLDPAQPASKLEFPENVAADGNAMLDIAIGYAFGQRGVWYLYKTGQSETLECTTLATSDQGALTYDFSPGFKSIPSTLRYNCVATPTGTDTDPFSISSDVYVGTDDGIYLFRGARAETPQKVTDRIKDVHQIIVKQDRDSIAVWAMCSPNRLYYIYGKKGATYTWNAPILFSESVVHLAPLRVRTRRANEIFVVNSDLSVTHHWQDPRSTLWQQRLIRAPKGNYLLNVPTFTTRLHLQDGDGNPLPAVKLGITASDWSYVTVNGLVYSLDHDTPAEIATDAFGSVTIIALASDISPPILHIESEAFEKTVNIYANGKIHAGLQQIRSGDDLKNARTASGPVVDPKTSQDTLDGVAGNVSQLTGASTQYVTGTRPAGSMFIAVEDGVKHTGALKVSHLPDNFAVGMQLKNGAWQAHPAPGAMTMTKTTAMTSAASFGGALDDIETFAGDALHWLEHAFVDGIKLIDKGVTFLQDGVSFVIQKAEDGLMFVLDLAGKAFRILLKTLGAVFKALNWMLKLIGIDLKKILEWLGHLFGWDEIWKAHKILASVMRSGLDCASTRAVHEIESWRAKVKSELSGVGDKVKHLILPQEVAQTRPRQQIATQSKAPEGRASRTPPAGFMTYQMQHGGMLDGDPSTPTAASARILSAAAGASVDPLANFMDDVVKPAISKIANDLVKAAEDLYKVFSDPSHTVQHLVDLLGDLIDLVVDAVAAIVDGALYLVEKLVVTIQHTLEDAVDIPFLSDFYEFITDLLGEEEELTIINATALIIAIPAVEICRVMGKTLFDGAEDIMGDSRLINKMTAGGASHPSLRAAAPVHAALAAAPRTLAMAPAMAGAASPVATGAARVSLEASGDPNTDASSAPSGAEQYTRWGTLTGSVAGLAGAIGATITTNAQGDDFVKKFRVVQILSLLGLCRFALTFPTTTPPYKTTAWTVSTLIGVVDFLVAADLIKLNLSEQEISLLGGGNEAEALQAQKGKIRGGLAIVRGITGFSLGLTQDIVSKSNGFVYTADITSNIGAALLGVNMIKPTIYTTAGGLFLGIAGAVAGFSYAMVTDHPLDAISNAGG